MQTPRLWLQRILGSLTGKAKDRRMEDEISAHLHMLEERFRQQGCSAPEARRRARLQFGSVTVLKEKQRATRGFLGPAAVWRDLCFGARMLKKNWLSNLAVVLALALGIGMNAAVFSFVNALLLRPPTAVGSLSNMAEIWLHSRNTSGLQSYLPFDYPDYSYYREHTQSFHGLLAFDGDGSEAIWNRAGTGQTIHGELVSGNYFSVLEINPAVGRAFTLADDQLSDPHHVIVISHSFWQKSFGTSPSVIGQTILLNGTAFQVLGVAPAGFAGLLIGSEPDYWAPLASQQIFTHDKSRATDPNGFWLIVAGRLKEGVSRKQAKAELQVVGHQLEKLHPEALNKLDPLVYQMTLVPGPYRPYVTAFTGLLLSVFVLVLIIACTNAAGLLLARSAGRTKEMAIRSALGATRGRIITQMLIESLMLSSIAGAAAILIAWAVARLLLLLKPASLPITLQLPFDWRVLLFTVFVSLATGLLFGLIPALRTSGASAAPTLKEESQNSDPRRSRLRIVLLISEIAVSVVLLTGATLCVRSLLHANSIDPGFDTHHIAVATLNAENLGYPADKVDSFYTRLLDRVRTLPAVTSASYVDALPLGTGASQSSAGWHVGDDRISVRIFHVDPGFFSTMGITLLSGRDLTPAEARSPSPNVVVVNANLAARLWPGQNPLGQQLAIGGEKNTREVVGVVRDGKYKSLGEMPVSAVFLPHLPAQRTLVVRTSSDDDALIPVLEREIQIVDPVMVATNVQTIEAFMALPLFPARATGLLLGASGVLALVLTTVGLFGVIAYVVAQRTREIGVRIALGARRSDVLKLVLRQGSSATLIGLAIGTCGAFAVSRLLSPVLYGISAGDPLTLIGVSLGLAAVSALACYLPARRAMRIDPASALRYE